MVGISGADVIVAWVMTTGMGVIDMLGPDDYTPEEQAHWEELMERREDAPIKFKICHKDEEYGYDEMIITGDTLGEVREQAKIETEKRKWSGWWSEEIK